MAVTLSFHTSSCLWLVLLKGCWAKTGFISTAHSDHPKEKWAGVWPPAFCLSVCCILFVLGRMGCGGCYSPRQICDRFSEASLFKSDIVSHIVCERYGGDILRTLILGRRHQNMSRRRSSTHPHHCGVILLVSGRPSPVSGRHRDHPGVILQVSEKLNPLSVNLCPGRDPLTQENTRRRYTQVQSIPRWIQH